MAKRDDAAYDWQVPLRKALRDLIERLIASARAGNISDVLWRQLLNKVRRNKNEFIGGPHTKSGWNVVFRFGSKNGGKFVGPNPSKSIGQIHIDAIGDALRILKINPNVTPPQEYAEWNEWIEGLCQPKKRAPVLRKVKSRPPLELGLEHALLARGVAGMVSKLQSDLDINGRHIFFQNLNAGDPVEVDQEAELHHSPDLTRLCAKIVRRMALARLAAKWLPKTGIAVGYPDVLAVWRGTLVALRNADIAETGRKHSVYAALNKPLTHRQFLDILAVRGNEIADLDVLCAIAVPLRKLTNRLGVVLHNAALAPGLERFIRVLFRRDEVVRDGPLLLMTSRHSQTLAAIQEVTLDVTGRGPHYEASPPLGDALRRLRKPLELIQTTTRNKVRASSSIIPASKPRREGLDSRGLFFDTLPDHPWIYDHLRGLWRVFAIGEGDRTPQNQRFYFHSLIEIPSLKKTKGKNGQSQNEIVFTWTGVEKHPFHGILGAALETLYFIGAKKDRSWLYDNWTTKCNLIWDIAPLLNNDLNAGIFGIITRADCDIPRFPSKTLARKIANSNHWSAKEISEFVDNESHTLGAINERLAFRSFPEFVGPLKALPDDPDLADEPFADEW